MCPLPAAVFQSFDPVPSGWSGAFVSPVAVHVARTLAEIIPVLEEAERAVNRGLWAVLMLSYEAAPAFDPAMEVHPADDFPLAWLGIFHEQLPGPSEPTRWDLPVSNWEPLVPLDEYTKSIAKIRTSIARGDCYQVNHTFPLQCRFRGDTSALFHQLGRAQGAGFSAWLDLERYQVLSFSPELFFERNGSKLRTRPMKGTLPRGRWLEEDDLQRSELQASAKNRAENLMIVDLLRNDLGRVSLPGSVEVPRLFEVERYETVFQMTSTIESTVKPNRGLRDILCALFPCGSVTGAPKISAMKVIRRLEPHPRRVYSGSVGFIRPGGSCVFNVAIRTLLLDQKTGIATCGVGGGITYDSTAEDEYSECVAKTRFLFEPRPPFELLETLRLEEGRYFLMERHLERMRRSAVYFGFRWDEPVVRSQMEAAKRTRAHGLWRVRVLASETGTLRIETLPMIDEPERIWRTALATEPFDARNRFLCHKTTHRSFYERPVQQRPDCDDIILWNERGEVTESSIANIVVEIEGQKWTPPRSSGLLAGTFREDLLAAGQIRERVILKEELRSAERFFLINSVKRWMVAALVD